MVYVKPNFKTKEIFKTAIAAGNNIDIFQCGKFADYRIKNGNVTVEGPHHDCQYHQLHPDIPHWRAQITLKDGKVIKVK